MLRVLKQCASLLSQSGNVTFHEAAEVTERYGLVRAAAGLGAMGCKVPKLRFKVIVTGLPSCGMHFFAVVRNIVMLHKDGVHV